MSRNSLIGLLVAGAAAINGAACSLRDKTHEDEWKTCEFYTESPNYPKFLQDNVFDKIYVGIDDTMKHPDRDKVVCYSDSRSDNYVPGICDYRLSNREDKENNRYVRLREKSIAHDVFVFEEVDINGFERNPERLNEIIDNAPWIFWAAENGGYVVKNVRDENGKIIERVYALVNGKKVIAKDINKDGILDCFREIN